MAYVSAPAFLGAGTETNDKSISSLTDDVTSTTVTPSTNVENKVPVHHGSRDTIEELRRESSHEVTELVFQTKFRDAKNIRDSILNENEDFNVSPSGKDEKEDSVSIYSPVGENKGDFSSAVASNQKTQFTASTNDEGKVNAGFDRDATASSSAAEGVAPLTSQNSQDFHKFMKEDAVETVKTNESLSEAEDGQTETVAALKVADTNVDEQTSDKFVGEVKYNMTEDDGTSDVKGVVFTAGVTEYVGNVAGDVTGDVTSARDKNDQHTLSQHELLGKTDLGDGKDTSLEAGSDVKDDCDDSFEQIGELEQPFGDQIGLTVVGELGVKGPNEKTESEDFELVLSREVEEALNEATGNVLNEGREELLSEPIETLVCENSEQSPEEPIKQLTSGISEQFIRDQFGKSVSEITEPLLNEELGKTWNDKQKSALNDAQGKVLNQAREPVLNDAHEPVLNKAQEPVLNEAQEPVLNEAEEPVLNEAQEPVLNEAHEPMLNEAQEPVSNDNQGSEVNATQEPVSNKVEELVFNEAQEKAVTKALEQVLNEEREQFLNETSKNSLNKASSISLTGCETEFGSQENETELGSPENPKKLESPENETKLGSPENEREIESPENETKLGSPDNAIGQKIGQDKREEESSHEMLSNQETELVSEIPTNSNQASTIPVIELPREKGERADSDRAAEMVEHDRVDEDIVASLVSDSCSATEGQDSEHAMNQPLKKESKGTFQEDVEILKSFATEINRRGILPSQIVLDEKIDEGVSLTSWMGGEEIESMASDKDGKRYEDPGLRVVTEVRERTSLKSDITTKTISVVKAQTSSPREEDCDERTSSSDHREVGDTPTSSSDPREVGDMLRSSSDPREVGDTPTSSVDKREVVNTPTSSDDSREVGHTPTSSDDNRGVHLDYREKTSDHLSRTTKLQDIATSTTQEPEVEERSPIKLEGATENQTRSDTTERNAENTSPCKSYAVKDDRGVCLTALKLAAVAVTGFGCAVSAPFALAALGFEAGGIVAGSVAAGFMSAASDTGIGLSIVSVLESVGISGLGLGAQVFIGAAGAGTAGGILAAAELLKRKSNQAEALHAHGSPEQAGGDPDVNFDEDEANNNEEEESESNDDYSIEEDTAGESTDDVSADVKDDDTLDEEDLCESGKDENYPRAEATEHKDECEDDDSVEGKQGDCVGGRQEDQLTGEDVIQGQDVINDDLVNQRSPESSALDKVVYDVTEVEAKQNAIIREGRSEVVNDLSVTSCEGFTEGIEHDGNNPVGAISVGVNVTPMDGGEDDYTDNPWKDEDCGNTEC